jgi:hypothetical protein
MRHWTHQLETLHACPEAVAWARDYASLDAAWSACPRGDWMLWLAGRVAGGPGSPLRRPLVRAACACARHARPYVRAGEHRPRLAIETAERWSRGEATLEEVRAAADAAADAADAADAAAYAAYAAYAAAHAAYAAYAAYAAHAAAYAADAAAHAADAAARTSMLSRCADLVRVHYPQPPVLP